MKTEVFRGLVKGMINQVYDIYKNQGLFFLCEE